MSIFLCTALLCSASGVGGFWCGDVVALCVRYIHRDGILSEAQMAIELLAWLSVDRVEVFSVSVCFPFV